MIRSRSAEHWDLERRVLGPGMQAVLDWAAITVESAAGATIRDVDGNEFIDFFGGAGVNSVGHSHPRLVQALTQQLSSWTIGAFGSSARLDMLQRLVAVLPAGLDRVQLYSSGSETLEAALRLARSATGHHEVLSFWSGYHGRTSASLAASPGAGRGFGPQPAGHLHAPYANCRRCPLRMRYPECGLACVEFAREVVRQQSVGSLAAVVVEPVQGRGGNVVPPPGFLAAMHELAREFGALLIVDELMTGGGRTGAMFAFEVDGVRPDIVTLGKGIGGGFPVGVVVSTREHTSSGAFAQPSANSSSFGGFPLACAAVATTMAIVVDEGLVESAGRTGARMLEHLRASLAELPLVGEVRGRGLAIGVELVDGTGTPAGRDLLRDVFTELVEAGVLVMVGGGALRLYPPLNVSEELALAGCDAIVDVLRRVTERVDGGAAQ